MTRYLLTIRASLSALFPNIYQQLHKQARNPLLHLHCWLKWRIGKLSLLIDIRAKTLEYLNSVLVSHGHVHKQQSDVAYSFPRSSLRSSYFSVILQTIKPMTSLVKSFSPRKRPMDSVWADSGNLMMGPFSQGSAG